MQKRFFSVIRSAAIIFTLCTTFPFRNSHAAPFNDIDGDGYSDTTLISIASGGALNWSAVSGPTESEIKGVDGFGVAGNHIALAPWFSTPSANLATISLTASAISWNVLRSDGRIAKRALGSAGDIVVSGGDFDGNNVADAVYISGATRLIWNLHRNPFAPSSSKIKIKRGKKTIIRKLPSSIRIELGNKGDTPFYADPDGRGDWIGIVKSGGTAVALRNPFTRRTRKFTLTSFSAGSLGVLPMRNSTGGDLLAFPVRSSTTTDIYFTTTKGAFVGHKNINAIGDIIVGNFTDSSNPQIAVQNGASFIVYTPATDETVTKNWGSGIAVDAININTLSAPESTPTPTPGGGGGDSVDHDNNPAPTGAFSEICKTISPMDRRVLYKPASQDTNDGREGKPAFLWYDCVDPGVENLWFVASNGSVVSKFYIYPSYCPYVRFYSGYGSGTGDTGGQIAAKARASSGSQKVYAYTKNGKCWGPINDPTARTGGR